MHRSVRVDRRTVGAVAAGACTLALAFAVAMSPSAWILLAEGSLARAGDTSWYIVGQATDCADGFRVAMRWARSSRIPVPKRTSLVALSGAQDSTIPARWIQANKLQGKLITWHLWLRGVRQTPVLVQVAARTRTGRISLISYGPRGASTN